jgi:hypothetical protein
VRTGSLYDWIMGDDLPRFDDTNEPGTLPGVGPAELRAPAHTSWWTRFTASIHALVHRRLATRGRGAR